MLILKLLLLLLKLITIFQLKIKHPIFWGLSWFINLFVQHVILLYWQNLCHFKTKIDKQVKNDKKSNMYKHLHSNEECFSNFNLYCFSILGYAPTQFQINIKEGMHIDWEKPNLNKQLNHVASTLLSSHSPMSPCFPFLFIKYNFRLLSVSFFYWHLSIVSKY